jgi:hypothetical protein
MRADRNAAGAPDIALETESHMPRIPRLATSAVVASLSLVSALGLAGPAAAKGGGGGGATTPAPAPVYLDCFGDFGDPTIPNMTDPDVAVNYAGEAGCVGVRVANNTLRLAWVVLADGWNYTVKSNGTGTNSRVQLQFNQASTGKSIDFRFEQGKTVIG